MKTKLCHCPANYCSAYGSELGGGGACRMDYDENGPISILRKNVDQCGREDGPAPYVSPEYQERYHPSERPGWDPNVGNWAIGYENGSQTAETDKMGLGYMKDDDWEPSSMLETHPDCRSGDINGVDEQFAHYHRTFIEQQRNGKRNMTDIDSADRIKQWIELLRSGEISSRPINLDFRTLDWLTENFDSARLEFPSEIKARQAKENAAILKEAEQLEARAKQLREKAAQTK